MRTLMTLCAALLLVACSLCGATSVLAETAAEANAVATAATPVIPLRRDEGVWSGRTLAKVIVALTVGAFLAVLMIMLMRRYFFSAAVGGRQIRILEARRATPQLTLLLVRVRDKDILVGQTGNGVSMLQEFPAEQGDTDDDDAATRR